MRTGDGARGVSVMPRPGSVARVEGSFPHGFLEGTDSRMTFRVMGPHEQGRFAPEAWGRLLQLKGSGTLSAPELEQVIERALTHIDGRIALDDLRLLLEGVGVIDDTDGPSADRVH
jgi:hypothetical protein